MTISKAAAGARVSPNLHAGLPSSRPHRRHSVADVAGRSHATMAVSAYDAMWARGWRTRGGGS